MMGFGDNPYAALMQAMQQRRQRQQEMPMQQDMGPITSEVMQLRPAQFQQFQGGMGGGSGGAGAGLAEMLRQMQGMTHNEGGFMSMFGRQGGMKS